jgi:Cobyrinic acid a,c-diamide synthase
MGRRGFIVAGTSSGAGKTTATLGILNALRDKNVQAFKVGPDFIDPSHHRGITGEPSYNLDPFLLSEETILSSFIQKILISPLLRVSWASSMGLERIFTEVPLTLPKYWIAPSSS